MSYPRQHRTCGGGVARELIRNDHPGPAWQPFEPRFEACLDRPLVATTLHQDVEDVIVLFHGPPQVMASAMEGQHDIAELRIVSQPGSTTSPLMGVGWAEYATPLTDRFVGHHHLTCASPLFDLAAAQAQATREPDGMTDDLGWTSVMCRGGG
jgi:hypothetical protein